MARMGFAPQGVTGEVDGYGLGYRLSVQLTTHLSLNIINCSCFFYTDSYLVLKTFNGSSHFFLWHYRFLNGFVDSGLVI